MKVIFFGLGSIGKRHARILQKIYQHKLYAFRSGSNKGKNELGIAEIFSWEEVEKLKPDVAFITNPTALHIETAIKCAKLGCKLFIEKPIGKDSKSLEKLLKIVKEKDLVTYVAYDRRFHPVITYLKKYLQNKKPLHVRAISTSYYPTWRKGVNFLQVYSARADLGGGVLLDLSHELDYMSYLLGDIKKLSGAFSRKSNVTVDVEDNADLLVEYKDSLASIHLNIFSQHDQQLVEIDLGETTVVGDLLTGEVKEYKNGKLKKSSIFSPDKDHRFELQLKYFFKNINNPHMMNNITDASFLFKKIIEFKMKSHG